jgi:hypothetical protein
MYFYITNTLELCLYSDATRTHRRVRVSALITTREKGYAALRGPEPLKVNLSNLQIMKCILVRRIDALLPSNGR